MCLHVFLLTVLWAPVYFVFYYHITNVNKINPQNTSLVDITGQVLKVQRLCIQMHESHFQLTIYVIFNFY